MWLRNGERVFQVTGESHIKRLLAEGFEETDAPVVTTTSEAGDDLPEVGDRTPLEYLSSLNSEQLRIVAARDGAEPLDIAPGATDQEIVAAILKAAGYTNQLPPPGPVKAG